MSDGDTKFQFRPYVTTAVARAPRGELVPLLFFSFEGGAAHHGSCHYVCVCVCGRKKAEPLKAIFGIVEVNASHMFQAVLRAEVRKLSFDIL